MKTLEQILEGVTAGGKWNDLPFELALLPAMKTSELEARMNQSKRDAAYAARACSTWPQLVRALEAVIVDMEESGCGCLLEAEAALAEALKE